MKLSNSILLSFSLFGLVPFSAGCMGENSHNNNFSDKPNIIVIVSDDMGWSDVGYHGSSIQTPHIDQLAKTGIRFSQHYVMPTCTPTRLSLLTGRYPSRYGITGPAYGEVIDLGDPTLPSMLSDHGYSTFIAGKWHLGSPPYTPLKYGFHSSYGYFDGQIDPYTHEYKTETKLTRRESWHRNDEYLHEEGHATDLITSEAVNVIEEERDNPFFLYVAYSVPHAPLEEPNEWLSVYDDLFLHPSRKWFAASVTHMDAGIGKIIDALERAGKRENTLVLFINDNGGVKSWYSEGDYKGKYANKPHVIMANNFPLRGWKGELYEGGIRVPSFINWPGQLSPGTINSPVHVSDWVPTLCNMPGIELKTTHIPIDGQDIWPVLTGEQPDTLFRQIYWKTARTYAVREGKWKLIVHKNDNISELYDIETDFREMNDLSDENPEKVKHLKTLLKYFKEKDR